MVLAIGDLAGRNPHPRASYGLAHLDLGEVPVARVDGLELAAVDRDAGRAEQIEASTKQHERAADFADRLAVVFAEIGDRFEIRHQTAGQPDKLDIALALALQASAGLDAIEVAVDIDLQLRCRMVGRPSR